MLDAWSKDEQPGAKRVFWLNGMAGTGKSTIARTVAESFRGEPFIVSSFFFSLHGEDVYTNGKAPHLSLLELVPCHRMVLEALRRVANEADVGIMLSCAPRGPLLEAAAPGRAYVDIFGHEYFNNKVFPRQELLIESDSDAEVTKQDQAQVDWVSINTITEYTELL